MLVLDLFCTIDLSKQAFEGGFGPGAEGPHPTSHTIIKMISTEI
jgi:hypothetical protein